MRRHVLAGIRARMALRRRLREQIARSLAASNYEYSFTDSAARLASFHPSSFMPALDVVDLEAFDHVHAHEHANPRGVITQVVRQNAVRGVKDVEFMLEQAIRSAGNGCLIF
jgi:hypothetical protein